MKVTLWYHYFNKPLVIRAGRETARCRYLVWLDADVLVLDEPEAFLDPLRGRFLGLPCR